MAMCIHHWMCDEPRGPLTPAHCRRCGESRTFKRPEVNMGDLALAQRRAREQEEKKVRFGAHYENGLAR
jgi:hypothetical protein